MFGPYDDPSAIFEPIKSTHPQDVELHNNDASLILFKHDLLEFLTRRDTESKLAGANNFTVIAVGWSDEEMGHLTSYLKARNIRHMCSLMFISYSGISIALKHITPNSISIIDSPQLTNVDIVHRDIHYVVRNSPSLRIKNLVNCKSLSIDSKRINSTKEVYQSRCVEYRVDIYNYLAISPSELKIMFSMTDLLYINIEYVQPRILHILNRSSYFDRTCDILADDMITDITSLSWLNNTGVTKFIIDSIHIRVIKSLQLHSIRTPINMILCFYDTSLDNMSGEYYYGLIHECGLSQMISGVIIIRTRFGVHVYDVGGLALPSAPPSEPRVRYVTCDSIASRFCASVDFSKIVERVRT